MGACVCLHLGGSRDDAAHVLRAVLVAAGKSTGEGINDNQDDGAAGFLPDLARKESDVVGGLRNRAPFLVLDLAEVESGVHDGEGEAGQAMLPAERHGSTLHQGGTLESDIQHGALFDLLPAPFKPSSDMQTQILNKDRLAAT